MAGDDPCSMLLDHAARLDRGMPDGWQRLTSVPETSGSGNGQIINTQDLDAAFESWVLPLAIQSQAYQDVQTLINVHASEAMFVSQTFTYNDALCVGGHLPVCLQTLMVVVRRHPSLDGLDAVEIWHVFVETHASAIDQFLQGEYCYRCNIFSKCCYDTYIPQDFSFEQIDRIQAVVSTSQALWLQHHLREREAMISPSRLKSPTRHAISMMARLKTE